MILRDSIFENSQKQHQQNTYTKLVIRLPSNRKFNLTKPTNAMPIVEMLLKCFPTSKIRKEKG